MKIEQIFEKLGKEVISIKDSSKGVDQIVKIVKCADGTYVYKEPKKEMSKILYEAKGSQLSESLGIPAPLTIKKTKNYLIQTYVEGKEISKTKPTLKVYKELGKYIQLLHTKKVPKVGKINCNEEKSEVGLINNLIKTHLKGLQKYLPKDKEAIEQYFKKNKKLLLDVPIVYCHSDLTTDNVKVDKGKFQE